MRVPESESDNSRFTVRMVESDPDCDNSGLMLSENVKS